MDEDAYQLLNSYLDNLKVCFRKEEGSAEIISDFEARIEELFSEKINSGSVVITIEDVEAVIGRMGKPADFSSRDGDSDDENRRQEQRRETAGGQSQTYAEKRFFRNNDDKMFGGVCSGIAAYFGWNTLAVRLISVVLMFATSFAIVPVYIILWILFPSARTAEEKLKMRGEPVTVENIGKTVAASADSGSQNNNDGCLTGIVDLLVGLIKFFVLGLGLLIGIPLLFALVVVIIALFAALFGIAGHGLLFEVAPFLSVSHINLAIVSMIFVLGIPLVALVYSIISHFAKLTPINKAIRWILAGLWFVALLLLLSSGLHFRLDKFDFSNVKWGIDRGGNRIELTGNGIHDEKGFAIIDSIASVDIDDYLTAEVHLSQQPGTAFIRITGDQNLVDNIKYTVEDGRLYLSTNGNYWIKENNNLVIFLQTPVGLNKLVTSSIGTVFFDGPFTADRFKIDLEGVGKIRSDSMFVDNLEVSSEGIGSVRIAGKSGKAKFTLDGAGEINAIDLLADSVYAELNGVGKIRCNPVDYLHSRINGVGKISYKEEPKSKNSGSIGIGGISKE
jgi:phage shock protein PspC (stress-responsive transcriptional regulator)